MRNIPEGRHSCPRRKNQEGGQECPPSVAGKFLHPGVEIEKHRNRLPHWQRGDVYVFVTWRLADSLPKAKLDRWQYERALWRELHPEPWDSGTEDEYHERFSRKIDEWLDQGSGECLLRDPVLAEVVAGAMLHFDGERVDQAAFVVMPNHVHALFRPLGGHTLGELLKSWKGFSAREINRQAGRTGTLWQEDYFDRLVRNQRHFYRCLNYIRENPAKAGLREGEYILYERRGDIPVPQT